MADRTDRRRLSGLLVPDNSFTYDALDLSASTVTCRAARGVPVPTTATRAVLRLRVNGILKRSRSTKRAGFLAR